MTLMSSPSLADPARRLGRVRATGARIVATAARRWFLDRDAAFWLGELEAPWRRVHDVPGLRALEAVGQRALAVVGQHAREALDLPGLDAPGPRARDLLGALGHRARVVAVQDETSDARTLVLAPGRRWPGHRAGQYVPIELEVDGVRLRRCYSISSGGAAPGATRIAITVRREPGGRVSHALHALRPGAALVLGDPAGDFVLPPAATKLLFVAGGSGITPIMAMLRDLAAPRTRVDVVVVHAARRARDAIFAAELASLAARVPGLHVHTHCSSTAGRLDAATLTAFAPDLADRAVFVCGPPGLIDMALALARAARCPALHHERFVAPPRTAPATATVAVTVTATDTATDTVTDTVTVTAPTVTLLRSGTRVSLSGPGPLLAQLERAGERPAHGCRIGICNTCRCRKRSGVVEDLTTGAISHGADEDIRLCVSLARTDLALEL